MSTEAKDLIAAFPAAGAGGTTLEQVEKLAIQRGMAYVAMSNPASIAAFETGKWQAQAINEIRGAADQASVGRAVLVGHCMGGLSALHLSDGLGSRLDLPVGVLLVNTPCPDSSGRIPTMSRFSDAEIAEALTHDGFPQEVLDDETVLAEVADSLRKDTAVGDRLAEWVSSAGDLEMLHVLSTRGDWFIPPEQCTPWRHRVSREFQLTITEGGHSIDETSIGALERALDSVLASMRAELV